MIDLRSHFGNQAHARVASSAAQYAMAQAETAYEVLKAAIDQAAQANVAFGVGKLSIQQLIAYNEQAANAALQAIHTETWAEQQFIAAGGEPAASWVDPVPKGGWDGLTAEKIRYIFLASVGGDGYSAQQRWEGLHGAQSS